MIRHTLRQYGAVFRQKFINMLQFRFAFWGHVSTNIFWAIVRAVIIFVYYTYGVGEAGISMDQAVTMVWLGQIVMNITPGSGMDFQVYEAIRSGAVGYELLRPVDTYAMWFVRSMASKLAPMLTRAPILLLAGFLIPGGYGMDAPASAMHLAGFVLALACALLLAASMECFAYMMQMDVRVGDGISRGFMIVAQLLSGLMLPLQLWPEWMQGFLRFQPFAGVMDLPLRLYTGTANLSGLSLILLVQLLWCAAFTIAGRLWMGRNLRKLVIQGG